ncbi:TerC/Alx family metal homeostasis membrane protein [Vibrio sp. S4M6]|uniref:TerC/Alx family metal homeostasis membrane protein n=1 Tax=Vibrio sinus TaxID=2946865 RepID=UPI002029F682|nr:TerC/Alx family metal homeostasis membrane protein [Vibrio sinus]MCL9783219.1 TerC/Alx family metal homeostasis membrane protein [Vibrio sinus]
MTPSMYSLFFAFTVLLVLVDIWQTRNGQITIKKAALWSIFWFLLAFAFAVFIYYFWAEIDPASTYTAPQASTAFITGYLLEKSLSVDNLFVFAIIFSQYSVPNELRPRALLLGVIGALILRGVLIVVGVHLLDQFQWLFYVFAAFLVWTGIHLAIDKSDDELNPWPEKLIRKLTSVSDTYQGTKLVTRVNGRRFITPFAIVLVVIAFTDVLFALDSIPAIFAVTHQPFLVLAANVFALLGLRSLYFVLQGMIDKFIYLKPALSFIMVFIGVKMALVHTSWAIPTPVSLTVLLVTMSIAVILSVFADKRKGLNKNEIMQKN